MKRIRAAQALPKDAIYGEMNSPVGTLTLITSAAGLHAIFWDTDYENLAYKKMIGGLTKSNHDKIIVQAKKQLTEYFQGKRNFFDVPLVPQGTPFQMQAWQQLLEIPYGSTISYAEQAEKIGNKNKARAVGLANGSNPISIIIPCHRVIGSNGHLVGFGGGLDKKAYLLALEKNWIQRS